jgi:hypothetical protein
VVLPSQEATLHTSSQHAAQAWQGSNSAVISSAALPRPNDPLFLQKHDSNFVGTENILAWVLDAEEMFRDRHGQG